MDRKISALPYTSVIVKDDILPIVKNIATTPANYVVKIEDLFGDIRTNVNVTQGTLTVGNTATVNTLVSNTANITSVNSTNISANNYKITGRTTPASNTGAGIDTNTIFIDNDYLYIKISDNKVKRVALSDF
jgi:vesicle coat complex subunit